MKKQQSGFTLIELVMVIVILGVLAAVAIPKYIDLKTDAQASAIAGVAAGISAASVINNGARSANVAQGTQTTGKDCQVAATALMQGGLPAGYSLDTATPLVAGDNVCTLSLATYTPTVSVNIIGIN